MDQFENNYRQDSSTESQVNQRPSADEEQKAPQDLGGSSDRQTQGERRQTIVLESRNKKKLPSWAKGCIILGAIVLLVIFLTVGCNRMVDRFTDGLFSESNNQVIADFDYDYIGTVHIEDTIDEYGTGLYNHEYILNAIDTMIDDPNNKGLILYINTPGGSVYASDELYLKIVEYQEQTGRPVYSSMQSQATSGGYYISAPCDKIIANRNCWTGSIGVTLGTMINISQLLENLGIETETITSGDNKSMGSGTEAMTAEQRDIFQSLVDESYEQFVGIVAEGRDMTTEEVKEIADGRIYTAKQALNNGLIDQIGTYEEAIADMKASYSLEYCQVEDFQAESSSDLSSLLGILSEQKNFSGLTDAQLVEELIQLNGTFRVSYISNVQK